MEALPKTWDDGWNSPFIPKEWGKHAYKPILTCTDDYPPSKTLEQFNIEAFNLKYLVFGEEKTAAFREVYVAESTLSPTQMGRFNLGLFSRYGHKKMNVVAFHIGPIEYHEDASILCQQGHGSHVDKHWMDNKEAFYTNCITHGQHNPFPEGLNLDNYCIATRDCFIKGGVGGCFINTSWGKTDAKVNCLRCSVKLVKPVTIPMKHFKNRTIECQYGTVFYAKDDIPPGGEFFCEYKGAQLAYLDRDDFVKPYPACRSEPTLDFTPKAKENFFEEIPQKEGNIDENLMTEDQDVEKLCQYVHKMVFESKNLFNKPHLKDGATIFKSEALKRKTSPYFLEKEDMRDGYTDEDNSLQVCIENLSEGHTEEDGKYERLRMDACSQIYTREDLEVAQGFFVDPPQWT